MKPYQWQHLLDDVPDHGKFISPIRLPQEAVGGFDENTRQWRVIATSLLSTRLDHEQLHPALWHFLRQWPDPVSVAFASRGMQALMKQYIGSCDDMLLMSKNWCVGFRPPELHGSDNVYVQEAYRIFVLDDLTFAPDDKFLASYVSWALIEGGRTG